MTLALNTTQLWLTLAILTTYKANKSTKGRVDRKQVIYEHLNQDFLSPQPNIHLAHIPIVYTSKYVCFYSKRVRTKWNVLKWHEFYEVNTRFVGLGSVLASIF